MSSCPECGAEVNTKEIEKGEIITCNDCGTELEVISTNPVKLEVAPEEQEDWGE